MRTPRPHGGRTGPVQAVLVVVLLLCGALPAGAATADTEALDVQADNYEFSPETGRAVGSGHVRVSYGDVKLRSDRVEINALTKDVTAEGHVELERGSLSWRGSRVSGNLERRDFVVAQYQAQTGVWYGKGASGAYHASGDAELGQVSLTTCEYIDRPHYSLNAKRVVYHANGKFTAYNVVYKVGSLPLFYLPVVFGDTSNKGGRIEVKPGYDSDWGAYLLLAREWRIGEHADTKMMLHLRSERGVAVGNRTRVYTDRLDSEVLVYGMRDEDPDETEPGYNRRFEVVDDRYRVKAQHRQDLLDKLTLRLRVDALSDVGMLEEWFRREYRNDPQPPTFADLTYEHERFSLSLSGRVRVNDFYSEVERLPEVRFDLPRQRLWDWPLYYQGQTTYGEMEMKWRDFDKDRPAPLTDAVDYDAGRFDTLHFLYLPFDLRDLVQVVPRAGVRFTHYDTSSATPVYTDDLTRLFAVDSPDNPDTTLRLGRQYDDEGDARWRAAGEVGLELSSKFYRVWNDYRSAWWDADGLRHVVQPYANYTLAPKPSEEREYLYFFDATDRLIEQNFIRLGLRQRWQTRRSQKIYTLARLENYADFHFANEEKHDDRLGDFATRFEFLPTDVFQVWAMALADMGEPDLNRVELGNAFGNPKVCRVLLSYLYRNSYDARTAYSMGSFLQDFAWSQPVARHFDRNHYVTVTFEFPINAKTSGSARYEFDIVEHELARQIYEIKRDLHCWMGALRLDEEQGDVRLVLVLYLKAYPDVSIDAGI